MRRRPEPWRGLRRRDWRGLSALSRPHPRIFGQRERGGGSLRWSGGRRLRADGVGWRQDGCRAVRPKTACIGGGRASGDDFGASAGCIGGGFGREVIGGGRIWLHGGSGGASDRGEVGQPAGRPRGMGSGRRTGESGGVVGREAIGCGGSLLWAVEDRWREDLAARGAAEAHQIGERSVNLRVGPEAWGAVAGRVKVAVPWGGRPSFAAGRCCGR